VRELKKHWLLRGIFEKMSKTNAVPAKASSTSIQPATPTEQRK